MHHKRFEHFDGAYAVVVELNRDRYRRKLFLTLGAAERAAKRARSAGHDAEVLLVRLQPVAPIDPAPAGLEREASHR